MRLIFLHGWGANAADLMPLGEALQAQLPASSVELHVQSWDAPDAHPAGGGARQWYDLNTPGWPQRPQAVRDLGKRLDTELRAAGSEPVVLFGFSQGAAMAIEVGLPRPLAGVIGCSGYPHPNWSLEHVPQAPTLLMHGSGDVVVPVAAQAALTAEISRVGGQVEVFTFSGGHTIPLEAVERAASFLAAL
jgi:phospholipase/carboxylesterase